MATWDIANYDCSSLTGWTDQDANNGASTQETFDSKSCYKQTVNPAGAAATHYAQLIGSAAGMSDTSYTVEVDVYISNCLGASNDNRVYFQLESVPYMLVMAWYEDGNLYTAYDGSMQDTGVDWSNEDTWQKWRFEVHNGGTDVDIYRDNVLLATDVRCDQSTLNEAGIILLNVYGVNDTTEGYYSNIKVDSSIGTVGNEEGVRIRGASSTIKLGCRPSSENGKARVYASGTTYGLCLVDTGDSNASAVRMYDGSDIKSVAELTEVT